MEATCRNRTIQWIFKQTKSGNISLTHKLQRREGQWNGLQKSELIDSLFRGYPVNFIYMIKENKLLSVIDGVQRISTIRDYLDDDFSLSKKLKPVIIVTNQDGKPKETTVEIAGKRFSKLPEEAKDLLLSCELQIYELTDANDADVREMFRRQNAGKPLNKTQLRKVVESDEMSKVITELASHRIFIRLLTPAQVRKDYDKECIRETLMLIETNKEHDYASFRDHQMNAFIAEYQTHIPYDKIKTLKTAMNNLDDNIPMINLNASSVPMFLYVGYRAVSENRPFGKLAKAIDEFMDGYNTNEEYKALCGQGTTSSDKVRKRFEYWQKLYEDAYKK